MFLQIFSLEMEPANFKELCSNKISNMSDCVVATSNSLCDLQDSLTTSSTSEIIEVSKSHSQYVQRLIARCDYLEKELWNLFQDCAISRKELGSTSQQTSDPPILDKESKANKSRVAIQSFTSTVTIQSETPSYLERYQEMMSEFYKIQNGGH